MSITSLDARAVFTVRVTDLPSLTAFILGKFLLPFTLRSLFFLSFDPLCQLVYLHREEFPRS